jgi:uncharacterized protein YndB with AHSA1/START domain
MADILQDFPISASPERVYEAISQPSGLDAWWTLTSTGVPEPGTEYALGFGPEYAWRALVSKAEPPRRFELQLTEADADWMNTAVGFELTPTAGGTQVSFYHRGWPLPNAHYRVSCHCWALYLRLLRRHVENGEQVPYEQRLDV